MIKTSHPFIGNIPVSKLLPALQVIARQNGLRLNRALEFLQASRIFCQQRKYNR